MSKPTAVLSIGYGRNLFIAGNADRDRMIACANTGVLIDMVIFTLKKDGLSEERVTDTLTLHPTNSRSRWYMVLDAYIVAKKIYAQSSHKRTCVVTAQDPFEAGLVGFFLKLHTHVPFVVQEHGDVLSTSHWKKESFLHTVRFYLGWSILARADVVRVVSKRTEAFLTRRGIKHITRLPVAISLKDFSKPLNVQIRPHGPFTFLTMARFVPQKNLALLLRAFSVVYKKHPNTKLVLVGRGEEEENLRSLSRELFLNDRAVTFLPWSDTPVALLVSADVYVLSSNYEGWGRVLIEALASGTPIVTTDVGCVGEVIKDGIHGIVTPVGDEKSLTEALLRMVEDETFYAKVKQTVGRLKPEEIPGTTIESYGAAWVHSLTVDE